MGLIKRRAPVDVVKAQIRKVPEVSQEKSKFIPTGSTLLNLALTDRIDGGWVCGTFNNLVGDSSAGKTFLAFTMFAEAFFSGKYKGYQLYYDEPEQADRFDAGLFGGVLDKLDRRFVSETIELWKVNCWKAVKEGLPYIYVTDSFDSIGSIEEQESLDDMLKKSEAGKSVEEKGSYKSGKAKGSGEIIRNIVANIKNTDSLHLVVSQTRDNIGVMFGEKSTRSGGRALRFYSTHEVWLRVTGHIKAKDKKIGVRVQARVKKNKFNGKLRDVIFPVYYDYGVDDLGSMVDWMVAEGFWKGTAALVDTGEDFKDITQGAKRYPIKDLIAALERQNREQELRQIVGECWAEIEAELKTERKPRYA